mmetsp:Transcript_6384/g.9302  ORF Transcript_6384/g.9302 Transcript_6384/m.9302 type:complete len:552 (+) Transcript_6384:38-1693(+)
MKRRKRISKSLYRRDATCSVVEEEANTNETACPNELPSTTESTSKRNKPVKHNINSEESLKNRKFRLKFQKRSKTCPNLQTIRNRQSPLKIQKRHNSKNEDINELENEYLSPSNHPNLNILKESFSRRKSKDTLSADPSSTHSPQKLSYIKRSQDSIINDRLKIEQSIHSNHKKRYAALLNINKRSERYAIRHHHPMRLIDGLNEQEKKEIKESEHFFPLFEKRNKVEYKIFEYSETVDFIEASNQCITSIIPLHFHRFPNISWMDLFANQISKIPDNIGELGNSLMYLSMSYNHLSTIPSSMENLTLLTTLLLSNNRLTEFPEAICNLPTLRHLELNDNQISDVPHSIKGCISLERLELANNAFESCPATISYCESLEMLILSNNQITYLPGIVPAHCQRLRVLCLKNNKLRKLPVELGYLKDLQIFRLHGNPLSLSKHEFLIDYVTDRWKHVEDLDEIPISREAIWRALNISSFYGNLIIPPVLYSVDNYTFTCSVPMIIMFHKWMKDQPHDTSKVYRPSLPIPKDEIPVQPILEDAQHFFVDLFISFS